MQRSSFVHDTNFASTERLFEHGGKLYATEDMLNIVHDNVHIGAERVLQSTPNTLSLAAKPRRLQDLPSAEDEGCCSEANPYVPAPGVAIVILCLDVFLPGVGTITAAYYDPSGCNCKTITCGIFQMLLAIVIVGWIWSIIQGVCIYKKSIAC